MSLAPAAAPTAPLLLMQGNKPLKFNPEAGKIVLTKDSRGNWTAEELAEIGKSDLFVIRNESGEVKAFKKIVRLLECKKEIAEVSGSWIITVQGYNRLNQYAGLHEITPPSIIVDGKEQSNPYVQYDEDGEIKKVIVRKMVIGYTVAGSQVVTDVVRHYNFDAYYMQDLQKKAEWKQEAARFGTELSCPFEPKAEVKTKKAGKNEIPYVIGESGKIYIFKRVKDLEGIWIDPSHSEIRKVYDQHIQHQKFGDVIAQNVASRNAKKAHPGIAATNVIAYGDGKEHYADVEVFGYRSTLSKAEAEDIADRVRKGEQVVGVEVKNSVEEANFDEVQDEAVRTVAAETAEEPKEKPVETPKPVEKPESKPEEPKQEAPAAPAPDRPTVAPREIPAPEDKHALARRLAEAKGFKVEDMAKNMFDSQFLLLNEYQLDKIIKVVGGTKK